MIALAVHGRTGSHDRGAHPTFPERDGKMAIIAASAELRERELIKLASLSSALARTLCARGLRDAAARLTGEIAIAVFRTAYDRWLDEPDARPLPELMRESLAQLEGVVARA